MSNDTFDRFSAAQVATVSSSSCSTAVASSGTKVWKVNASLRYGSDSRMTCSGCSIFSPWSSQAYVEPFFQSDTIAWPMYRWENAGSVIACHSFSGVVRM